MSNPISPPPGLVNGAATPATAAAAAASANEQAHSVIGINFGNAYASIAVINKEGRADTIANEDGERQIACAISFNGSETYVGNQALPQLVKNSANTILGFRNYLGKSFAQVGEQSALSAQLGDVGGVPMYTVSVAPAEEEGEAVEKQLSVRDVTALFLRSLLQSAQDFLSHRLIRGAVLSCPSDWTDAQRAALLAAAEDAGVNVISLLDEAAAAVLAYAPSSASPALPVAADSKIANGNGESHPVPADRRSLVLDIGASSTTTTLISVSHHSLLHVLHRSTDPALGGHQLDAVLLSHFAKEFSKKTGTSLSPTSTAPQDLRALAKLRAASEVTKRSLSATTGSATLDVESLKDGLDYHGSINALRFDLLARGVYSRILAHVRACLDEAGLDQTQVDELVLVGGTASLPGIADQLQAILPDPPTVLSNSIDPSNVVAIGCALQARLSVMHAPPVSRGSGEEEALLRASALSMPVGLVFPPSKGFWEVLKAGTPLPARRKVRVPVPVGVGRVGVEVWEGKEEVRVESVVPPKAERDPDDDEEEEEEEEEPEEVRTLHLVPVTQLAALLLPVTHAEQPEKKGRKAKAVQTEAEVEVVVGLGGEVRVRAWVVGAHKKGVVQVDVGGW
ncbi:actin-like ATPase domain-containing protein [Calocera viscosa TUFC12733]|uniref:Actin-like ATPase domain-containing protein n=1 Tax=Calocera viscosa (strain TUFC12733) TaxID=1330018 RepID=A0A167RY81_CALVF|nr:actin-like ATPase domain-containing protein [Calocera viscosa TUFC12733]